MSRTSEGQWPRNEADMSDFEIRNGPPWSAKDLGDVRELSCQDVFVKLHLREDGTARPGVLLLHELPGMVPSCITLARDLHEEGFSVFMPLLLGRPGDHIKGVRRSICIFKEWNRLATDEDSPLTRWARRICREIQEECAGRGVGAIGMCLSGAFVIPLILEDAVVAPVACQPAAPLGDGLPITEHGLERVRSRCQRDELVLLGYRFRRDLMSQRSKWKRLRREFGDHFRGTEFQSWNPFKHSTLTLDRQEEAFRGVVELFRERLERSEPV